MALIPITVFGTNFTSAEFTFLTGFADLTHTHGDTFFVNSAGQVARLPAGTEGQLLTTHTAASDPTWTTVTGTGTVTSVSVTTANGVSGTVATATTTPAITLTLGAITPTSVNGLTLASTSITSAGALSLVGGGTNQNVTLTPSGTGHTVLNGNVGIGTTAPNNALTVIGNFDVEDSISPTKGYRFRTNGAALDLEGSGAELFLSMWSGANFTGTQYNQITFNNNGGLMNFQRSFFPNTSDLSMGQSTNYWANTYSTALNLNSTASIDGNTAGAVHIVGNVGIGTTAPGALLDLGLAGTTLGVIRLAGNTSGNVSIQPNAVAGTEIILTLPATTGTLVGRTTADTLTNKTLTAPVIGGAASLADGATISRIVPTVDGTATGPVTSAFVSGYTSSAIGDLVILDSSGKWQKTDANTASIYNGMLGIALAVAATDEALKVALPGSIVYATGFPTMTIGAAMYMSETAGVITATAPTTTDSATRIIGYAVHADKIFFFPSNDWITHT